MTDPHVFSVIGNAYSDEILHRQGSPFKLVVADSDNGTHMRRRLRHSLSGGRLQNDSGERFSENVTACHEGMAVTVALENRAFDAESRYSAAFRRHQVITVHLPDGGRLLADRALSKLLKMIGQDVAELERRLVQSVRLPPSPRRRWSA